MSVDELDQLIARAELGEVIHIQLPSGGTAVATLDDLLFAKVYPTLLAASWELINTPHRKDGDGTFRP